LCNSACFWYRVPWIQALLSTNLAMDMGGVSILRVVVRNVGSVLVCVNVCVSAVFSVTWAFTGLTVKHKRKNNADAEYGGPRRGAA
jgi:hypothetical protein